MDLAEVGSAKDDRSLGEPLFMKLLHGLVIPSSESNVPKLLFSLWFGCSNIMR